MATSPPSESRSVEGPGSCVLCCGELEVVALGRCDHPICYRCSVRMRALCGVRYCAVCREDLAQVVFGKKLPAFSTIILSQLQHEKKYDIYFTDEKVDALYRKLLQHECPLCLEAQAFPTILDLEQHMRKQHELFCCKLCVKHLKIFTYERKWYSRKDLAWHRIHGDPDDTSHRGHPLCKFCDERYLDNDELLMHLRRDHYFCHFCDSDGAQEYYSDYEYLCEHFREKHFLCEEGRCSTEQFTHAFRTEIDYKAHKSTCHSKNRAEARQNRQIDLQFNYILRHQRRTEGVVNGEDHEQVDRYNRQLRGGRSGTRSVQQNRRGSWQYKREEEDRHIAAAVRATIAAKRQEDKKQVKDKEDNSRVKKKDAKDLDTTISKRGLKSSSETLVSKEVIPKSALSQDDFLAIGCPVVNSVQSSSQLVSVKLDEDDFPSLSFSSAPPVDSAAMPLLYSATTQKTAFQEEDFPALVSKVQPSSFNSVVLLNSPPPPPGLSVPLSKAPPGFTRILPTSISENAPVPVKEPKFCQRPYLILENFQQRNIQLIQSIKEFLQEDESQFNKFKTFSGQFRQGLISAVQYYKSCQELLGDNFKKVFNELLVLLPDTAKQQELLSAYNYLKVRAPSGSSPSSSRSKNQKMVWQMEPASTPDCCICPTCQQVLTQQDLVSHQALHLEEEFPSLQAISRIIS